jgi:hypothetical protein
MEITIHDANSIEDAKKRFDALWKLATKKGLRVVLIRPLYGLILILIAVFSKPYESSSRSVTTPDGVVQHISYFNLNIFFSIGIVIILYFLLELLRIRREKNKLWTGELKKIGQQINIQITTEHVTCQSSGITTTIQWNRFSGYKEFEGFLFLLVDDSIFSAIEINKELLTAEELKELRLFLGGKSHFKRN